MNPKADTPTVAPENQAHERRVPVTERTTSRPGHTRKSVQIPNADYARLQSHVDRECLDMDKFLTKLISQAINTLRPTDKT